MSAPVLALPTAAIRRRDRDLVDAVWDGFASLRLTIPLLFLLAAACTLGTFANPENRPMTEIRAAIGYAWWFPGYLFFELNDLFHSWWFVLLLVVLGLNLTACTIERLPRIFRIALRPEKRLSDPQLRGIKHSLRLRAKGAPAKVAAEVAALLRARGWKPELLRGEEAGFAYVFAEKGRYSRFGVWIVHLSLFLILSGALLGRLFGMEGIVNVPMNGGTFDFIFRKAADGSAFKEPLGFTVRVDDFRLLKYLNGNPRSFESDLAVLNAAGQPIERRTIKVGEPLVHGGWTFYQASYQADPSRDLVNLSIRDRQNPGEPKLFHLAKDGVATMPDGVRFAVTQATDHFAQLGPAVQIARTAPDGGKTSFWVFQKYPDFDADNRGDRWGLRFDGLDAFYFTGLQVARDPGYPLWLAGCCILFLGLGIAFYTSHRRLWARVTPAGELVLAGAAHKNQAAFEELWNELASALRKAES
ncbi:MAG: cytochrome c biogenesis protein ResB [Myxococcales bacterium]